MPQIYSHVCVIECADAVALEEVLAAGLERYLVRRLSPTAAIIDHEQVDEVIRLLRRQGQTPKVTEE